jgi:hypothetical protein
MADDPNMALEDLRRRIRGGIREGEAEIINEACKPFLVRVLTP